jgi:hypothetical protein
MDGTLLQAPVRGQPVCLAEEGLGRNPTDRGRSGSKLHLHVEQQGVPLRPFWPTPCSTNATSDYACSYCHAARSSNTSAF